MGAAAESAASNRLPPGVGLGWRPALAGVAAARDLAFLEVVAETVPADGRHLSRALQSRLDAGVPVVAHGVSLGIGSAEPLDPGRLQRLGAAADRLKSPVVSEHLSFVGAGGLSAGHLLPLPRTGEAIRVLTQHIRQAQAELPVPLALEHVAALFEWPDAEMGPAEFLCRIVDATGCLLVLDVANLYGDSVNFGHDPLALFEAIPMDRVAYVHVAGGILRDGVWHDSHAGPVPEEVFALVGELARRRPGLPMLLERDDRWPTAAELGCELDRLGSVIAAAEAVHV